MTRRALMLLTLRLLSIFPSSDSTQVLLCSLLIQDDAILSKPLHFITAEERFIYLLTFMPFCVYSASSLECCRYVIVWKMSNLISYKVFNWSPSKSCRSHPLSQYAHLCCIQGLDSLQSERKSLYLFPIYQQTALIMYLLRPWNEVFHCFSLQFWLLEIPCRTFQRYFISGRQLEHLLSLTDLVTNFSPHSSLCLLWLCSLYSCPIHLLFSLISPLTFPDVTFFVVKMSLSCV